MWLALLFFFFITLGLGFASLRLLNIKPEGDFEAFFAYLGGGLAVFVISAALLGFFPLASWPAYLLLTLAMLAAAWRLKNAIPRIRFPKLSRDELLVLAIFAVFLFVYVKGAWAYPYLEDDDPWSHAAAVRYVSEFSTYIQPPHTPAHYLAPYPPFYDVLLGVMLQIGGTVQEILKNFNALLISLAIPFFYLFMRQKFGGSNALWGTFILAILPCFMSHFIWSQTLCMLLVFPSLYFIERYSACDDEGKRGYFAMAALASASVFMTQPSAAAMYFGLLAAYIAAKALSGLLGPERKPEWKAAKEMAFAFCAAFGLALALFWVPMFVMYPAEEVFSHLSLTASIMTEKYGDTGGGLVYGFGDFFHAPNASKMDQPVGFGEVAFVLLIAGSAWALIEIREGRGSHALIAALLWLAYGFVGTEGNLLPVKLVPHRFWVFLAIPVAILAGIGAVQLLALAERKARGARAVVMAAIILGLLATSASPKYVVETSQWPPGVVWVSAEQIDGYVNLMGNLAPDTKVYSFCLSDEHVNGFNLYGYPWVKEIEDSKKTSITQSDDANYELISRYGYEYAVIDQGCMKTFTVEQVNGKLNSLSADGRFEYVPMLSSDVFVVFRIK